VSFELRCHHCSSWLGESREPLKHRGSFETPRDREVLPEPRDSWRCKGCGWVNVFRPYTRDEVARSMIEVKSKKVA
jgi:hypothetical protein